MAADRWQATCEQIQTGWQRLQSQVLFVLVVFEWLLIGSTWPLWSGQSDFPAVPLLQWLPVSSPETALARMLLFSFIMLTVLYGASLVSQPLKRVSTVIRVATLLLAMGLVIINQHRLQPWHWLFGLSLLISVLLTAQDSVKVIRFLVATVYIFSALSRISPDMGRGMTGQIAGTIFRLVQLPRAADNPDLIFRTAALFAVAEFAIGCGLLWPRFRNASVALAVLLHVTLITALGPVGLGHHHGVLIWNLMFVFLVPVLFRRMPDPNIADSELSWDEQSNRQISGKRHRRSAATFCSYGLAFLVPASGLFGIADNWLSWQLYSPRPEVYGLFVRQQSVAELPDSLQNFVSEPDPVEDLCVVRLDRWSLAETGSPMYPEDRFQLAVIRRVTAKITNRADLRITIDAPNRIRWWKRSQSVLDGTQLPLP